MTFCWKTEEGRRVLTAILSAYQKGTRRVVLVTGGCDTALPQAALSRLPIGIETLRLRSPEQLSGVNTDDQSRIVLLSSLACEHLNLTEGIKIVERFCRSGQYELIYAPHSFTSTELASLRADPWNAAQQAVLDSRCARWMLDIAHEVALCLSCGILACYDELRGLFMRRLKEDPSALPAAYECQEEYIRHVQVDPQYQRARQWLSGGRLSAMLKQPEDHESEWLMLWSMGLAGMTDGAWKLSPALLEWPGLYRERMHRVITANHRTLPPIYMAWVYYCEREYAFPEMEGDSLASHYPVDIQMALKERGLANHPDYTLALQALTLRNWLQHGENYERSAYQNGIFCHKACINIMRRVDPDGFPPPG